jgi:hypothetical protein
MNVSPLVCTVPTCVTIMSRIGTSQPRNGLASKTRRGAVMVRPTSAQIIESPCLSIGGRIGGSTAARSGKKSVPNTTVYTTARTGVVDAKIIAEIGTHKKRIA